MKPLLNDSQESKEPDPWWVPCKFPDCGCFAQGCCGVADA